MMTVSSVSRTPREVWPTMPQDFRRKSSDDYDPDFPPPSLKPPDDGRELEKKKKKEKKWSIGGLFRRKKKVSDTDSSSPIEDEEEKKGFLERRRAARKKRNRGSKDVTGSFEHVRMNNPTQAFEGILSHQREFKEITNDRLVGRSHESLTKKHQENHIRGSSASLEGVGRRGSRIQVKARVEANREMLRIESSSDEGCESSRHSSSSVPRGRGEDISGSKEGSLSRRSRAARNERYKKRFSKDEESLKDFQAGSVSRICRSDEKLTSKSKISEKTPINNKWTAKVVYYESSDYDTKYTAKTKSATPSPLQSPKTRPKNALHFTASAPPATNYVTYPPSHTREGVAGSHQELRSHHFPSMRSHGLHKSSQRYPDVTPPRLPKSNSEMITNPPCQSKLQNQYPAWDRDVLNRKSASYDCHVNHLHFVNNQISKPHPADENVLVVQFPISRPCHLQDSNTKVGVPSHDTTKQQNPPPPPPRDPHRRLMASNGHNESGSRPMSYAFEERSSQHLKHQTFPEFGSKLSAFHRVPQTAPIDIQPTPSINVHHRSSSDHHIPNRVNSVKMSPPMTRRPSSVQQDMITKQYSTSSDKYASSPPSDFIHGSVPQHYQYYTDQQPRSRKPIHIACQSQNQQSDQYTTDPQVAIKPPVQQSPRVRPSGVQNATEFWKQMDQECAKKVHLSEGSPKLIQRHLFNVNGVNENSRRNSLPKNDMTLNTKSTLTPLTMPSRGTDSSGSLSSQSSPRDNSSPRSPSNKVLVHNEIGIPVFDGFDLNAVSKREFRPLSMLEEKTETSELEVSPLREKGSNPPLPPTRRDSKVSPATNFAHLDISSNGTDTKESRRKSNNLEEALNELEAIYKSLRLGEEDHEEKVSKQKAVYENNRLDPSNWNAWVQSRGFESDSSFNYSRSSLESVDSIDSPIKRTSKSRQHMVPDRVADDMAFRKLNKKEKPPPHEQEVIAQAGSFLLVSPTLSPPPFLESIPSPPVKNEPDITLDDVVYRNIKHVNNTLKVLDPQPPFGIPLGPVTPAPNSDYLHVTPTDVYRPTFKPRKTPDVVTDDLAFRNLRKDSNKEPLFSPEDTTLLDLPTIKKKRAVRSLSANLLSIIQKESLAYKNNNHLVYNNNVVHDDLEKSQSFTDLVVNTNINGTSLKQNNMSKSYCKSKVNVSEDESDATPRVSRHFHSGTSSPLISTSTETLTDSKVALFSQEPQQGSNPKVSQNSRSKFFSVPERRHTTEISNPFKRSADLPIKHVPIKLEPLKINYLVDLKPKLPDIQRCSTPDKNTMLAHRNDSQETEHSSIECSQSETDLLSILAREAKEASEQFSKELNELDIDEMIEPITHTKDNGVNTTKSISEDKPKEVNLYQNPSKPISIGKIIPHKPVKLNTFRITEDNKLENKQTELNLDSNEIESSKSMADLLKELTRSLDFDFGSPKGSEKENTPTKEEEEERENESELDMDRDTDYPNETIDQEVYSEAIEPRDKKDVEENYFSSLEEVPDRSLSSPELSLLRSLSEMSPEESAETVQNVSPVKNSFPLVLPDENVNEDLTASTTSLPGLTELPRERSPGAAGSSDATRVGLDSTVSVRAPAASCSSSRDSTVPGCSAYCSNMTDEGKIRLKGCVSQWTDYLCQP